MNKNAIISAVHAHRPLLLAMTKAVNFLNLKNRLRCGNGSLELGVVLLKGLKIENHGTNNHIVIDDFSRIHNSTIIIHGNNNHIHLKEYVYLNDVELYTENDGNTIEIGCHTGFSGTTHAAVIEGTRLVIGERCLFSGALQFRTGDSHSILNLEGKRTNPSRDILIGDHVWIGSTVTCLKDTHIANDCIVAATTTLCGHYDTPNCIIGGVPGRILKTGVNWTCERIPVDPDFLQDAPPKKD